MFLYLDGILRQIELRGELAPLGPADVVLLDKLLLQPADLLAGEGRAVPPDVVQAVVVPAVPGAVEAGLRGRELRISASARRGRGCGRRGGAQHVRGRV